MIFSTLYFKTYISKEKKFYGKVFVMFFRYLDNFFIDKWLNNIFQIILLYFLEEERTFSLISYDYFQNMFTNNLNQ